MSRRIASVLALGVALSCAAFVSGTAYADDDVAALVVDNGGSVPEPSTLALLALGAVGMVAAAMGRHKGDRKKSASDME